MSIILEDVTSGYNLSLINTNFQTIESYINDKLLARASTGVAGEAQMGRDLDMNGNAILNAVTGTTDNSLVTKGYVDSADEALDTRVSQLEHTVLVPLSSYYWYTVLTADAGTIVPPVNFTYANVFLDGISQIPGYSFTISNNTIVFANTVKAGTKVYCILGEAVNGATGDYVSVETYQNTLDALASLNTLYTNTNNTATTALTTAQANTISINTINANKPDTSTVLIKANNLSDVASASASRTNLGLGGAAVLNVGTSSGTVAAGNDSRFSTIDANTGGVVDTTSSAIVARRNTNSSGTLFGGQIRQDRTASSEYAVSYTQVNTDASYHLYSILYNAGGTSVNVLRQSSTGGVFCDTGSFTGSSDERVKYNIKTIENPIDTLKQLRGVSFTRKDSEQPGYGYIAQEVQAVLPDAVTVGPDYTLHDGTVVEGMLYPDTAGVSAAVLTEALKATITRLETVEAELAAIKNA